ncbi:MAG: DNA repair protein RecO [Minisyncoccota bacterium]
MELRYNAIVLKKKEVGETDRLYTLYTKEQGKIQVAAKGVRKQDAKLAGQLETLMQGLVIVVKGRGAGRIAGAVAERSGIFLRIDGDILHRVMEAVAMFERLVGWDEADPVLFHLLMTYLVMANEMARKRDTQQVFLLTEGFLFQLFARLGYEIEMGSCVISGEKLKTGNQYFFSPGAGGVLSGNHIHQMTNVFPISEDAIKLIRIFLSHKLESLSRVRTDSSSLRQVRQMSTRFFEWIRA